MNKYRVIYKCRICGGIEVVGKTTGTAKEAQLEINKTIAMEQHMNDLTGNKKLQMIHTCANGSVGIADLCGYQRI